MAPPIDESGDAQRPVLVIGFLKRKIPDATTEARDTNPVQTNPAKVAGAWRLGWSLDDHTRSSEFLGYDENGRAQFETIRSPLGELLYQLKYRGQRTAPQLADVLADFFDDKPVVLGRIDMIVPVPASSARAVQPVVEIAKELGTRLKKPVSVDAVKKTRQTPRLKDIFDAEERRELLDGAFEADQTKFGGRGVLLLDDLYRSGATANAVTLSLLKAGAARVYFLAVTRTRSNT